jgi:hypothetical protein
MVVSPRSSHSFGLDMVWHYIVVICEWFFANGADSVLFEQFSVYELFHLRWPSQFTISRAGDMDLQFVGSQL